MTRFEQLQHLLEEQPNEPFLIFALAKEYENQKEYHQALFYYQKLSVEHTNYVGTYYHFGKLLEAQGNPQSAIDIYKKGIEIALQQKDLHSANELRGALFELDDD